MVRMPACRLSHARRALLLLILAHPHRPGRHIGWLT
jgi:hypothetical protein